MNRSCWTTARRSAFETTFSRLAIDIRTETTLEEVGALVDALSPANFLPANPQAIDELNRAFHGAPPSGFVQPPFLVTKDNIHSEGGDQNTFIPSNDYKKHYLDIWGVK